MDELILVDWKDHAIGTGEKLPVHAEKKLHRAFSLIVIDRHGRMLVQMRASGKYHSAGLLANTCCSHPRHGEALEDAVVRRSEEELGIAVAGATEIGSFVYLAPFDNGLVEYEYDHVFLKVIDHELSEKMADVAGIPFDTEEIASLRWVDHGTLMHWVTYEPGLLAYWFLLILRDTEMGDAIRQAMEKQAMENQAPKD